MSNEFKELENLKKILLKAQVAVAVDDNDEHAYNIFSQTLNALSIINDNKLYDLKNEVFGLLKCSDENIRSEALATLCYTTRLHIPGFETIAYDVWLNDPSDLVKRTALSAWSSYFVKTKNKDVLKELYHILKNEEYSIIIRAQANTNLFKTVDPKHTEFDRMKSTTNLLNCKTSAEFNSKVNWSAITKIMQQYAPEVLEQEDKK